MFKARYISVISCLMLLVILSTSAADDASREAWQLEKLEQDRDKAKKKKNSVLERERSVLAGLKSIGKDLASREKELRIYEHNLSRCEREIKKIKEELAKAELRAKQTQSLMLKRLRAMYKFGYDGGQLSYLKLLLEAEGIPDLTTRYKYMSAIASADKDLVGKALEEKAEIDSKKEQVEARKKRILNYEASAKQIRDAILKKRRARQAALNRLRQSKDHLTQTLNELERAVEEKESLIARLRDNSAEGVYEEITDLGKQRGKLPWPTAGKIVKNSAVSMNGVTIQAKYGTNIRCVAGGMVEYAQWFDGVGFGQMVIVDHGYGYRTLYAHASELLVNKKQRVKTGQIIAKVGDTGSLKGSILYFEIWKGTKAMLTKRWLK